MVFVKGNDVAYVHIAYAIAVRHAKRLMVVDVIRNAFEATAGLRICARVYQCDLPRLSFELMHLHAVGAEIESDVRHMKEVIGKVLLDEVSLVSAADDELIDSVMGVDLHDVPQDRHAPYFDHWLGA